jgi:hypothetical protein
VDLIIITLLRIFCISETSDVTLFYGKACIPETSDVTLFYGKACIPETSDVTLFYGKANQLLL